MIVKPRPAAKDIGAQTSRKDIAATSHKNAIVQPEPRPAAKDIAATSYIIRITVSGVNFVLIERLTVTIERYLRISAEDILIARNNALSNTFDLSCLIRYPKLIKKRKLQENLHSWHIKPCFGEKGDIGVRTVHVDAKPFEHLNNSAFQSRYELWSAPPWSLVY